MTASRRRHYPKARLDDDTVTQALVAAVISGTIAIVAFVVWLWVGR